MKNADNKELNPGKIFDTCYAFAQSRVLATGVDLRIFTYIVSGRHTALEVAKAAQADQRRVEIILNSLVALNFLTKSGNTYDLTPLSSNFLVEGVPNYYGDFVRHLDLVWDTWKNLTETVRSGKPSSFICRKYACPYYRWKHLYHGRI